MSNRKTRSRSAKTGKYVSKEFANQIHYTTPTQ